MQKFLENLQRIPVTRESVKTLPESAGIYVFFASGKSIYIGKTVNLRSRVLSYFDINLETKTKKMISEAQVFGFIRVTSELEALLLEAKLIRKCMPRYNITAKDDKHPLYIQITKEKYPRVLTARKLAKSQKNLAFYGPFPSSTNVRLVLKMLRRIFPYSDHKIGKRACLYSHLGLCNPCPSEIERIKNSKLRISKRKEYLGNIRHIKKILDGNIESVRLELERKMKELSSVQNYEGAALAQDQIKRLEYITQPKIPTESFLENPNLYQDLRNKETEELTMLLKKWKLPFKKLHRIECFDVSHLAGTKPTASMITFIDAEPDKDYYRRFKVGQSKSQSDTDSMKEIIMRRKEHFNEWGKPDLIIVDGGKAQVGVFIRGLGGLGIPVIGLAKRFETLVIPTIADGPIKLKEIRLEKGDALNLVQRIRDEAHRFARQYHHALISKELVSQK